MDFETDDVRELKELLFKERVNLEHERAALEEERRAFEAEKHETLLN